MLRGNLELVPNVARMRTELVRGAGYDLAMRVDPSFFRPIKPWLVGGPLGKSQRLCPVAFGSERLHIRSLELSDVVGWRSFSSRQWLGLASEKRQIVQVSCGLKPGKLLLARCALRE